MMNSFPSFFLNSKKNKLGIKESRKEMKDKFKGFRKLFSLSSLATSEGQCKGRRQIGKAKSMRDFLFLLRNRFPRHTAS